MTDPNDALHAFEVVAAAADAQADEMDRIEHFQVDIADIIARQVYMGNEMRAAGLPELAIAHTLATMAPEWWWERNQKGKKS